jgi:hypothetical protein
VSIGLRGVVAVVCEWQQAYQERFASFTGTHGVEEAG